MSFFSERRVLDDAPTMTVLNKIDELLVAHPAWTRLADAVDGGYTARQYRCSGAVSGLGYDWVLSLVYITASAATSTVTVQASEDVDGAGALVRGCVAPTTQMAPSATYAAFSDTTAYPVSSGNWNRYLILNTNPTDFTYYVVVTDRGLWLRSTADTYAKHAGLFEPFWDHVQEFPLYLSEIGTNDPDGGGSYSRRPSESGRIHPDVFALDSGISAPARWYSTPMGTVPDAGELQAKAYGTRLLLNHGSTDADNGEYRGLAYNCLIYSINAAVEVGDTIQVDGQTYVMLQDAVAYGMFVNTEAS